MANKKQQVKPVSKSKGNKFLIIALFIVTSLLFFVCGVLVFWFFQQKQAKKEPAPSPSLTPMPSPVVEISPSPEVPIEEPIISPFPSPQLKSDLELIREAMASRHSKPVADTTVNISKLNIPYASGGVKFEGEIAGAWLLAYKTNDGWVIVEAGNGTVTCELIEPYNFPVDMVPECWSETDGLVVR